MQWRGITQSFAMLIFFFFFFCVFFFFFICMCVHTFSNYCFQSEVEETLKRIQHHKGVIGVVIVNSEGKP